MKKILFLLLCSIFLFSACSKPVTENPDKGFNEMYGGDSDSAKKDVEKLNLQQNDEKKTLDNKQEGSKVKINQTDAPKKGDMVAIMETSMGTIKIKLFPTATPKTYGNFKGLSDKGYYNGLIFHRVINSFMIQGGDPTGTGRGGESIYGGDFEDEPREDLKNIRGALSMANRGPNTNGSQFFIVQAQATPFLDGYRNGTKTCGTPGLSCHTVFGQVFEGIEIIDKIAGAKTGQNDKPVTDIVMKSVKVEEYK